MIYYDSLLAYYFSGAFIIIIIEMAKYFLDRSRWSEPFIKETFKRVILIPSLWLFVMTIVSIYRACDKKRSWSDRLLLPVWVAVIWITFSIIIQQPLD